MKIEYYDISLLSQVSALIMESPRSLKSSLLMVTSSDIDGGISLSLPVFLHVYDPENIVLDDLVSPKFLFDCFLLEFFFNIV